MAITILTTVTLFRVTFHHERSENKNRSTRATHPRTNNVIMILPVTQKITKKTATRARMMF